MRDAIVRAATAVLVGSLVLAGSAGGSRLRASPSPQAPASAAGADTIPTFSHDVHGNLACTSCHRMNQIHGAVLVQSVEDCRSCHHTSRSNRTCRQCHDVPDLEGRIFDLPREFSPSVEEESSVRELPFRHEPHERFECTRCHTDGPDLAIPNLDCRDCHEEHHSNDASCFDCHVEPREGAHNRTVHVTCTGSGCHESVPVDGPPRTRTGCLWCHQDQTDHMVGKECVNCHVMPPARTTAAATGASP